MPLLSDHVLPLDGRGTFQFHCHPGVGCFTECCRELELALTPYDVMRLRDGLSLNSRQFFDQYALVEFGPDDLHPKVYLGMIDDGRASCPFVGPDGCRIYPHRPSACRTYPVGRGVGLSPCGSRQEQFVIIHEPHCLGFSENRQQTVSEWINDQEIAEYNRFTDLALDLLPRHNNTIRRLHDDEASLFLSTLYFLEELHTRPELGPSSPPADGAELLAYAMDWLKHQWQQNHR